jgi:hypothetical protein
VLSLLLVACGGTDASQTRGNDGPAPLANVPTARADLPAVLVYKTEGCGCCNGWVEHLRAAGYNVDARNVTDLTAVKLDAGVPADLSSCHTALIDGYVVEGHVPADVIERLLTERPPVAGISAPGMPVGSPGMEGPGARPYEVYAFDRQGARSVFAEVDPH